MNLKEKLQRLGFDLFELEKLKPYLQDVLCIFALVWPRKAHAFYKYYYDSLTENEIAKEMGISERQVRRLLKGYDTDVGAEDIFLILLQLMVEADAFDSSMPIRLGECFTPSATGRKNPLAVVFHRAFLEVLLCTMLGNADIQQVLISFPWSKDGSSDLPMHLVAWPCCRLPLKNNHLPGLYAVLKSCSLSKELPWICAMVVELYQHQASWMELSNILNCGNSKIITHYKSIPATHVDSNLPFVINAITKARMPLRFLIIGVLAKTLYPWKDLVAHLPNSGALQKIDEVKDRVMTCYINYSERT